MTRHLQHKLDFVRSFAEREKRAGRTAMALLLNQDVFNLEKELDEAIESEMAQVVAACNS